MFEAVPVDAAVLFEIYGGPEVNLFETEEELAEYCQEKGWETMDVADRGLDLLAQLMDPENVEVQA